MIKFFTDGEDMSDNKKPVSAGNHNKDLRLESRESELVETIKLLKNDLETAEGKEAEAIADQLSRAKANLKFTSEQIKAAKNLKKEWDKKRKSVTPMLKQVDMARDLNISTALISSYMNGRQGMNTAWVLKFAKYLEIEPSQISPYLSEQIGVQSFVDVQLSEGLEKCTPEFKKIMLDMLRLHIAENSANN